MYKKREIFYNKMANRRAKYNSEGDQKAPSIGSTLWPFFSGWIWTTNLRMWRHCCHLTNLNRFYFCGTRCLVFATEPIGFLVFPYPLDGVSNLTFVLCELLCSYLARQNSLLDIVGALESISNVWKKETQKNFLSLKVICLCHSTFGENLSWNVRMVFEKYFFIRSEKSKSSFRKYFAPLCGYHCLKHSKVWDIKPQNPYLLRLKLGVFF